ncbi:MAG: TonB-dependent receptor [Candidatus Eremiobacteraeota bacterium]|nr:TonB-dependent receptor [Candidatus Eremiobacteraeota bacterium]
MGSSKYGPARPRTRRGLEVAVRLAAGLIASALLTSSAQAQPEDGQITISVAQAKTKTPLALARVLLNGPVMASELTRHDGVVLFRDAPAGVYTARVGKAGYQSVTTAAFEVVSGRAVSVGVELAPTADVKTLGTVVVKSSAVVTSDSISQDSVVRKLSPTLSDALGKLAGVSVAADSTQNDAAETISLEGHDPSQTQLMLDGVPLNSPGSAGDLRSIDSDLFTGAAVNFNPVAGALGGSVNYRTLEPTTAWQTSLTTNLGNLGSASTILSEQGTLGRFGIAYVHTVRGSDSLLDGQAFADTSGLAYVHAGANQTDGDLVKLRTQIGQSQSLSGTLISSNGYNDALCRVDNGALPCGYGPGNANYRHFTMGSLSDSALIGLTSVQLSLFGTASRFDRNLLNRYVDGVASPYGSEVVGSTRGASLSVQLPARERHTLSLQATTSGSDTRSSGAIASASTYAAGQATSSYSSLAIADSMRSNDKLTLGDHLGFARSNGRSSLIGGLNAAWAPTSADGFSGSVDLGSNAAGSRRVGLLSDPQSLQFDCAAELGYGSGPGDEPGAQTSLSARAGWQHRFGAIGQLSASLYRQVQHDTLLNALVNAAALPSGYFPADYFQTAGQIYQSGGGCGLPSVPFGASNVYLNVPLSGVRMVYEGLQLSGTFNVTRYLAAAPFYNTQVVEPFADDPRLDNVYSPVISGSQLPGVPLHQAGLTLDYRGPHSAIEWLADAQYVSRNNRNNLPGYVTADAGASVDFAHGALTVSESNVFNKYGYAFASSAYSAGLPTVGTGALSTIARPLSPRQFNLTYSVKVGSQVGAAARNSANALASARDNPSQRPGGGGPRGFVASLAPYPTTAPADPFAADTGRPSCSPEAARAAAPTLAAMKAYADAVRAAKTQAGYPAALPASMPQVPGFSVGYHSLRDSYALTFSPLTMTSMRAFISCAAVHVGQLEQAAALHLYVPDSSSFFRSPLAYTPAVGLYIVRRPQVAGQEQFRVYRLPGAPPPKPLAIVSSDRCSADLRPIAARLLAGLEIYIASGDKGAAAPAQPQGWTVVRHRAPKGPWLELQPQAPQALPALLGCARVSAGSQAQIEAAGFGAAPLPALNFSQPLGLYMVRRQPPAGRQD